MSANTAVARTTHHLLNRHRAALVGARTHTAHLAQSLRATSSDAARGNAPCVDCPAAA